MNKYFFISVFLFTTQLVIAQSSILTIKEIDSIVSSIDTTCVSGGITDYAIKSKNKKTKEIINGGGADWYYVDTKKKLVKVVKEISLDTENFDTYYFYHDTLIYLKSINYSYNDDMKIINWKRECYFQGDKLVLSQDNLKMSFIPKNYLETAKEFFIADQIWRK